ncbi:MAG: hypothetical protein EBS42_06150 [Caulobacteraceae bacterium]|nr:hypothetical protein [Caulobacteraceae bacterium]
MSLRASILALMLLTAPALSGCGRMGELERPGPLWGPEDRAKEEAAQRAASAAANKPSKPGSDEEVRDPATSSATIRQQPIAGSPSDPLGGPSAQGMPNSGPQQ